MGPLRRALVFAQDFAGYIQNMMTTFMAWYKESPRDKSPVETIGPQVLENNISPSTLHPKILRLLPVKRGFGVLKRKLKLYINFSETSIGWRKVGVLGCNVKILTQVVNFPTKLTDFEPRHLEYWFNSRDVSLSLFNLSLILG